MNDDVRQGRLRVALERPLGNIFLARCGDGWRSWHGDYVLLSYLVIYAFVEQHA